MSHFWLPEIAAAHGGDIDRVIVIVHVFMAVLFVGWISFFTLALLRFRKGKNPVPDYKGVTSHRNRPRKSAVAGSGIRVAYKKTAPAHVVAAKAPSSK